MHVLLGLSYCEANDSQMSMDLADRDFRATSKNSSPTLVHAVQFPNEFLVGLTRYRSASIGGNVSSARTHLSNIQQIGEQLFNKLPKGGGGGGGGTRTGADAEDRGVTSDSEVLIEQRDVFTLLRIYVELELAIHQVSELDVKWDEMKAQLIRHLARAKSLFDSIKYPESSASIYLTNRFVALRRVVGIFDESGKEFLLRFNESTRVSMLGVGYETGETLSKFAPRIRREAFPTGWRFRESLLTVEILNSASASDAKLNGLLSNVEEALQSLVKRSYSGTTFVREIAAMINTMLDKLGENYEKYYKVVQAVATVVLKITCKNIDRLSDLEDIPEQLLELLDLIHSREPGRTLDEKLVKALIFFADALEKTQQHDTAVENLRRYSA